MTGQKLGLIHYPTNQNTPEFTLDYALAHEFGHLFDFTNQLNKISDCKWEKAPNGDYVHIGKCEVVPGSWGAFSWTHIDEVRAEQEYAHRKELCFYFCNGKFIDSALSGDGNQWGSL
jgi:hypothetical protein